MPSASHGFEVGEEEEEDDDVAHRHRRFSGPSILRRLLSSSSIDKRTESGSSTVATCNTHHRSSFFYQRLPEHLIKLSILKLDGSSFEIHVGKAASVSELKLAVETVFTQSPKEEGSISWSHVWGHFCLCYVDHKLTDNKALLRNLGIKDGDQLHFIRHLSMNFVPPKRRPSKVNEDENCRCSSSDEGSCYHTGDEENGDLVRHAEFRFGYCLQGWFSYARLLNGTGRTRSSEGTKARMARFRTYCQRIGIKELLP